MAKDRPSNNIFDEAAKRLGKKKKKKTTPSAAPLTDAETPTPEPAITIEDEEAKEMLRKIHEMEDDLDSKMDHISQLSGMTKKEMHKFIENPNNFSSEKWGKAQKDKEALEKKIFGAIGIKAKNKILKKKKKKITKGRRGKTLGARKGWMQM
ncbi:MAG: hypothetical protein K940chlam7_01974 [Chlamydiae bacterium]|nr:hypothetical protein [Chlamydiota bacterium]